MGKVQKTGGGASIAYCVKIYISFQISQLSKFVLYQNVY